MSSPGPPLGDELLGHEVETLALVALHTASAVVLTDARGCVEWVNPAFVRLTRLGREAVRGKPIADVFRPPGLEAGSLDRLRAELARGEATSLALRAEAGSPLRLHVEIRRIPDPAARGDRLLVLATDVTALRLAHEEELRLRELAFEHERREALARLAGGVARRLEAWLEQARTQGEEPAREPRAASPLLPCALEAWGARSLARTLRTLAGERPLVTRRIGLSELVVSIASELERLAPKHGSLALDLAAELPRVRADVAQLRELLAILVANAFEALGETGSVRIRTGSCAVDVATLDRTLPHGSLTASPCVSLQVSDAGEGIDPSLRRQLFDPFFSTRGPARGLGLAAALGITHAHRGGLLFESAPGRGTQVTLFLPVDPLRLAAAPPAERPRQGAPRRTVLLLEDEAALRARTQRALRRCGYRVLAAPGGATGLERFREHAREVDAVVMTPPVAGSTAAESVRRMRLVRPDVRFVLVSSYRDDALEDALAESEVARFVPKPYTREELADALRAVLAG